MACVFCPKTIQLAAAARQSSSSTVRITVSDASKVADYQRLFPNASIRQQVMGPGRIQLIITKTKR